MVEQHPGALAGLVHGNVAAEVQGQRLQLQVATPCAVLLFGNHSATPCNKIPPLAYYYFPIGAEIRRVYLGHTVAVVIKRLIVLYKRSKGFLVGAHIRHCGGAERCVAAIVAIQLIGDASKQAVAVASDLADTQAAAVQLAIQVAMHNRLFWVENLDDTMMMLVVYTIVISRALGCLARCLWCLPFGGMHQRIAIDGSYYVRDTKHRMNKGFTKRAISSTTSSTQRIFLMVSHH